MQNHPLPTLWASLTLGILCEVDTDVSPCAAPIQQGMVLLGLLRSFCRCLTLYTWLLLILALLI